VPVRQGGGGLGGQFGSAVIWQERYSPAKIIPDKLCYSRVPPAVPPGFYAIVDGSGGNALVNHVGSGVYTISANAGGFASSAISSLGIAGDFVLRIKALGFAAAAMVGMNSDPLTSTYFDTIDFAWEPTFGQIYENSAAAVASPGTTAAYYWIWRIGTNLYYGRGATQIEAAVTPDRTVGGVSGTLYFDSTLGTVGDSVEVVLADLVDAPVELASETDTVLALAPLLVRAVGLSTETDSALGRGIGAAPGRSAETDTTLVLAAKEILAVGLASETDSGVALAAKLIRTIGIATETDAAQRSGIGSSPGRSGETDTALARSAVLLRPAGLSGEVDTAFALSAGGVAIPVGRADETDAAVALVARVIRTAGLALELDAAFGLAAVVIGGRAKVWDGAQWTLKPSKVWTGSAWVEKPVKVWDGSGWRLS
jgi:hypothetical protein